MIKFSDIEMAFEYVSFGAPSENSAFLSKESGKIFYYTEYGDNEEELPEDVGDVEKYIEIPHKNDLGLGRSLAFKFAAQFMPGSVDQVYEFFSNRGAYRRYKQFLADRSMLEQWHEYENEQERAALREWCELEKIEFED